MGSYMKSKHFPFRLADVEYSLANTFLEAIQERAKMEVDDRLARGIPLSHLWLDAQSASAKAVPSDPQPEDEYLRAVRKEVAGRMADSYINLTFGTPSHSEAALSSHSPPATSASAEPMPTYKITHDVAVASSKPAPPPIVETPEVAEFCRRCERRAIQVGKKG